MADFNAGSASIRIRPNLDGFKRDTEAALKGLDLVATVNVEADLSRLAGLQARLDAESRARDYHVTARVEVDTARGSSQIASWRGRQAAAPAIKAKYEIEESSIPKMEGDLKKALERMKAAGKLNGIVLAVDGAAGVVAGLLGVADSAAKAANALALLPALGFAAGAGLASVIVGSSGIKSTFSDMKAASADAAGSASDQADKLHSISDAQYNVSEAQRGARTAQVALNDAYRDASRNLRDMNNDLAEQKLATEDAGLAVAEAQQRLNQVNNDPRSDSLTKKRADLDYRESLARLQDQQNKTSDAAQDTARANAAGVSGSKEVTDATQAQADAQHRLEEAMYALAKAQQGSTSGAIDKLANDMAKLSPNAREFVTTVRGLGPAWKDLRTADQDALFKGMGDSIKTLADKQLPTLKAGLVGISSEINTGLRSSMAFLSTDGAKADFATSLTNTQLGFHGLASAAAPLTEAFTKLVTVGSSFLPELGDGVGKVADKFDKFITTAARSGELRDFMQEGITAVGQLGSVLGNLGSIVSSVFHAAGVGSAGLKGIDDVTERIANLLKSVKGQDTLITFFENGRAALDKWVPILEQIPKLFSSILDGVHAWAGVIAPIIGGIADLLTHHTELVKDAVIAYLAFKTVGPLIRIVEGAMAKLTATTAGQAAAARIAATANLQAAAAGATAAEASAAGTAAATTGLSRMRAAGAGALGILGNPWIIGLAAAGAATVGFISSLNEAGNVQRNYATRALQVKEANEGIVKALRESGGSTNDSVLDAEQQRIEQFRTQLSQVAKEAPSMWDKIVGYTAAGAQTIVGGGAAGQSRLDALGARDNAADLATATREAIAKSGLTDGQFAQGIAGSQDQFNKLVKSLGDGKTDFTNLQRTAVDLRNEFQGDQASAARKVAESYQQIGKDAGSAADDIDRLTTSVDAQNKQANAVDNARLAAANALQGITRGVDNPGSISLDQSGAIDLSDFNNDSAKALVQGLQGAQSGYAQAIAGAKAWGEQNKLSQEQITASVQKTSDDFTNSTRQQLVNLGLPLPMVDELLRHYNLVPEQKTTNFTAKTDTATVQIDDYVAKIKKAREATTVPLLLQTLITTGTAPTVALAPGAKTGDPILDNLGALNGHATGGFLPTTGPGTDREDGIMAVAGGVPVAMVDGGEHVTNRDMSVKYAPELQSINAGTFPKLAAGGVIPGGVTPQEQETLGGGSINTSIWQAVKAQFPDAVLSSGYRAGDPGYHGIKQAVDIGGPSMQQIADWIFSQKSQFAQLIWNAGPAWYNVKKNQIGTGVATAEGAAARGIYGEATMAQHGDHVHAAAEQPIAVSPGVDPTTGAALNVGGTPTTSSVTYAQAALPGARTDDQLSLLTNQASVDQANSDRNKVYADSASTAADKRAADIKYQQAQNTLQSSQSNSDDFSLKGFAQKGVGILVDGLLGGLGLDNSILSSNNPYNQAISKVAGQTAGAGYAYTPKNLPSTETTYSPTAAGVAAAGATTAGTAAAGVADPLSHAYNASGGVEQWRGVFAGVLSKLGLPAGWLDSGLAQMTTESGGNPQAQNNSDSNAQKGTPSKGLMQVIDPTFASYHSPLFADDIWDPAANIAAGTLYAKAAYNGDPTSVWGQGHGYDQGGIANGIGLMPKRTLLPERVLSPRQTETFDSALPLLESLNQSSTWSSPMADNNIGSGAPGTSAVTHDNSSHFHGDNYAQDPDDMIDAWERRMSLQSLGATGGWGV